MTTASVCPHGFPSPASCLDCFDDIGLGAVARDDREQAAGPTVIAEFPGRCGPCDEPIRPGETIAVTTFGRWAHTGCVA